MVAPDRWQAHPAMRRLARRLAPARRVESVCAETNRRFDPVARCPFRLDCAAVVATQVVLGWGRVVRRLEGHASVATLPTTAEVIETSLLNDRRLSGKAAATLADARRPRQAVRDDGDEPRRPSRSNGQLQGSLRAASVPP